VPGSDRLFAAPLQSLLRTTPLNIKLSGPFVHH
jgi:hypothetical protein